ncbi:MAG: CoA pyrophosphatase [Alphaproteobacteria bacterium]|nr:CoA pyrophosphatase [Alphaproteobacteria bacterium]
MRYHVSTQLAAYQPKTDPAALRGDHVLSPHLAPPAPWRPAAVLVPLVEREGGMTVLLTRRTDHLADHAGQISFPGGRLESTDRDPEAGALRETEEELGIPRTAIELVGRLDTYLTRTGFEVVPVVGLLTPPFPLKPDRFEVADVFEVPLGHLLEPANYLRHERLYGGRSAYYYAIPYGDRYIWGATAGMLRNLCEALRD